MKRKLAHIARVGMLFLCFASCDRSVPGPDDSDVTINGYRIEGQVLDGFLRPLVGVQVVLYYGLAYVDGDSVSRAYTPAAQGEFVTVEVKNTSGQAVRVLFAGLAPQDSGLYIPWDYRDDDGAVVRSGLYTVTYSVTGNVRKSYRQVVDGNPNDTTDAEGRFVIPESDLPVGEIAPFYTSSDVFDGEYEIMNEVFLRFVSPAFSRTYKVVLLKDKVTNVPIELN